MPPVLDALQAIFPDLLQQPVSVSDKPAHTVSDTPQTPSVDVTQAYSGRITAINTKLSAAIDDTTQQQRYLDAQQQQAKHADEEALAQADVDYTPGWRQAGLPIKPSHLKLDPLLVQSGGLVNPKSVISWYGARNTKEVLSPLPVAEHNHVGADPHYCTLTSNLQVRNKLVPAKRRAEAGQGTTWRALPQEDLKARLASSAVRRKAMTQAMPKDQWDLEKRIVDSMQHKLGFLRNPRFPSPQKYSGIPKAVAGSAIAVSAESHASRQNASPNKRVRSLQQQVPFRAEPSQVLFQAHEQGQRYHELVTLHNATLFGQRLRLLSPLSPYFSFSTLEFYQSPEQGLVAPGMHAGVTVTFSPDALHDYDDTMIIETGQGRVEVPLRARRDPPCLDLPQLIVVGPTLEANRQVLLITCSNSGGPGHFHVSREGQGHSSPGELQDDGVQLGPFRLCPAAFALEREEQMQLQIVFEPDRIGEYLEVFTLKCNNGTQTAYHLSGTGANLQVQLGSLDGRRFTAEEAHKPIWFGEVAVGAKQHRVVRVTNPTPLPLPFCWQQTDDPVSSGVQHAQRELTDGRFGAMQFHVEPAVGILEAGSESDMTLLFAPESQHRFQSWAQLIVDASVPGTAPIPRYSQMMCEVSLEGYGTACAASVWPPIIAVPGHIQLGQVVTQHLTVGNPGHAVAAVTWTSSNPAVTVEPSNAIIAVGSEQQFQACIQGSGIGQLQAQLQCLVKHGAPQAVEVTARVTGPAVQFTDPGIALGLLQLGKQVTQTITIHNTSRFSPATWTLKALPQRVSSSSDGAAKSDHAAQHAQQAAETANQGVPAVLQAKQQQLLQQLQDAAMTSQGAASEADESRSSAAAADVATAAQSENPFEGLLAAEEGREEPGCSLVIEPECGILAAGASATVQVQFCANTEGNFDTILELFTAGGAVSHISVTAAVAAPSLALSPTLLDLGVTHLGVPQQRSLTLSNLTMLPTTFSWEAYGSGGVGKETGGGQLEVTLDPPQGIIEPGSQQSIHAVFTPTAMGKAEVLVACCTDRTSSPAGFSAVSHVKGVSVAYTVQLYPTTTPLPPPVPLAALSAHAKTGSAGHQSPGLISNAMPEYGAGNVSKANRTQQGRLVRADFGDCSIGDTKSLLLTITNESPIAASVNLWLDTFQADLPLTQPSVMAGSGSLLPRSPIGQRANLSQLSTASGMSASRGLSPTPTLHLGSTADAGGVQGPTPTVRLGSAADARGMQGPSYVGSTAGPGGSSKGSRQSARRAGSRQCSGHGNVQTLASLRLSDEAERSRPFASPMGQLMVAQRTSKAAAQQAVGNKGIAIGVGPPQGVLAPDGVFTCILTCNTDMCGEYVDNLHVQVGDLLEKKIPVHVSVTGTPLIMQLGKVLLPGFIRNPPAAEPLAQPLIRHQSRSQTALRSSPGLLQNAQEGLLAGMALPFGQLLADTPTERAFFVFNTASMPMQLDWTFYRYGLPGPLEARASQGAPKAAPNSSLAGAVAPSIVLTVHLLVDEAGQTVSLSTTLVANHAVQPFVVTPSTAVISGNSSARFTVAFRNADAMLHEGYLLGAQSVIAPKSRVALHCTVAEEEAESAEQIPAPALSETAVSHQHSAKAPKSHDAHAAMSPEGVSSAQVAQRFIVTCHLTGGFHPHAGPPSIPLQPLKLGLQAEVIQPYLEPEFPDATDGLRFVCHATHDPSRHPSYRQTVVLTNMHNCPLRFAVSMAGAAAGAGAGQFQVVRAACSSVSRLEGLQPKPLLATLPGVTHGTRSMQISGSEDLLRLSPHEHVSVCIHYMPQQHPTHNAVSHAGTSSEAIASQPESTQSAGRADDLQDESASDQLIITYSNGHQQAVPVHAQRLRPVLEASVTQLRFGSVHVQSPKTLEVELSNPSSVAAEWSVQLQSGSTAAAAASVSFAPEGLVMTGPSPAALPGTHDAAPDTLVGQQKIGADAAFSVSPGNGILLGRGLVMPRKQKLLVTFAPRQSGACTVVYKVLLVEGRAIEIALSGEATYSQADETQAQLQNM